MTAIQRKADAYRQANLEAARIVAADPVKYPGLMQEWANMVLDQVEKTTVTPAPGPLFKPEAA